jgi:D-amino-acid dehydrogenase
VQSLLREGDRVTGLQLSGAGGAPDEQLQADAVVLAAGSYSRDLLLPLGFDIPVYPVKG